MICKFLAENRYIQTGSHRKQPPQADSQEKRKQTQVQPLCPVRPVKKTKFSLPVSPWCSVLLIVASLVCLAVLLALPLVVRFGRSAAQILQNGPRQQGLLGWLPLVVRFGRSAAQILQNGPRQQGLLGWLPLVVRFGRSAAQILQNGPCQLGLLGCAPCSPSGGPFWLLSSPNPPKRTSPAWSAWLCSLLSLWWSVLAAQRPKSSKTDLAMLVCLAVLLALPLVVPFGRSAAQILQNGPRQLGLLGCAPCSPSGGPFWPLSSPNPPKRTSPTLPLTAGARRARTLNLR